MPRGGLAAGAGITRSVCYAKPVVQDRCAISTTGYIPCSLRERSPGAPRAPGPRCHASTPPQPCNVLLRFGTLEDMRDLRRCVTMVVLAVVRRVVRSAWARVAMSVPVMVRRAADMDGIGGWRIGMLWVSFSDACRRCQRRSGETA